MLSRREKIYCLGAPCPACGRTNYYRKSGACVHCLRLKHSVSSKMDRDGPPRDHKAIAKDLKTQLEQIWANQKKIWPHL